MGGTRLKRIRVARTRVARTRVGSKFVCVCDTVYEISTPCAYSFLRLQTPPPACLLPLPIAACPRSILLPGPQQVPLHLMSRRVTKLTVRLEPKIPSPRHRNYQDIPKCAVNIPKCVVDIPKCAVDIPKCAVTIPKLSPYALIRYPSSMRPALNSVSFPLCCYISSSLSASHAGSFSREAVSKDFESSHPAPTHPHKLPKNEGNQRSGNQPPPPTPPPSPCTH